jgi:hypothetical protein
VLSVPVRNDDQAVEEHYHSLFKLYCHIRLASPSLEPGASHSLVANIFLICSLQLFKQEYTSLLLVSTNGVKNFSYKVI